MIKSFGTENIWGRYKQQANHQLEILTMAKN